MLYRTSARHTQDVWTNVITKAAAAGMSQRAAAAIMGIAQSNLSRASTENFRYQILTRPPAQRLAEALSLAEGAETFIADLPRYPSPARDER